MPMHADTQAFIDDIKTPSVLDLPAAKAELLSFTQTVLVLEEQIAKWSRLGKVAELREDNQQIDDKMEEGMLLIDGFRHDLAQLPTMVRNIRKRYNTLRLWVLEFEDHANQVLP